MGIPNNQSDRTSSVKIPASHPAEDMQDTSLLSALRRQPIWIILAISSGAGAAFNGVFAKLTTTALTSTLSSHIATFLSLSFQQNHRIPREGHIFPPEPRVQRRDVGA